MIGGISGVQIDSIVESFSSSRRLYRLEIKESRRRIVIIRLYNAPYQKILN